MSDTFVFHWNDAQQLLEKRDRFTRKAIMTEFETHPLQDVVVLDDPRKWYATPVANNRYAVVWQLDEQPAGKVVNVKAVVPAQLGNDRLVELKDKLEKLTSQESNEFVTLALPR